MDRFHIVIYNYENIELFLDNIYKVKNFNKDLDRIIIIDCSNNYESELNKIKRFARKNNYLVGDHLKIIRRKNWGIDQGARIKYFQLVLENKLKSEFAWQFQEHYLDTESNYSKWPKGQKNIYGDDIGGKIKEDIIPPNIFIDLDRCESIYTNNPNTNVIYAITEGLGLYKNINNNFFIIHGANFSLRCSEISKMLNKKKLDIFRYLYNGHYDWALFMECIFCQIFTTGGNCYDLVTDKFHNIKRIKNRNCELNNYYIANDLFEKIYRKKNVVFKKLIKKHWILIKLRLIKKALIDKFSF